MDVQDKLYTVGYMNGGVQFPVSLNTISSVCRLTDGEGACPHHCTGTTCGVCVPDAGLSVHPH